MMGGNMMNGSPLMGGGYSNNITGGLFELFFWGLIIVGAVLMVNWFIDRSKPALTNDRPDAMEVIKLRYAKGEIDQKEFESMRANLSGS